MHIGEASRWAGVAMKPFTGAPWPMLIANGVAAVVAVILIFGYGVLNQLDLTPDWGWAPLLGIAAISATMLGNRACRLYALQRFKSSLADRGVPNPLVSEIELTGEGVRSITGAVQQSFPWSAVSEALKVGPYWVLIAQATPVYIPVRMMGDAEGEARFVAELRSRLSTDALRRSSKELQALS